jgi:hypothetical protein
LHLVMSRLSSHPTGYATEAPAPAVASGGRGVITRRPLLVPLLAFGL